MKVFDVLRRMIKNSDELVGRLGETNARLREVIAGLDNQSRLINDKQTQLLERTAQLVAGVANQSRLLGQKSEELIEGVANQSSLLNDKLKELLNDTAYQTRLVGSRLEEVVLGLNNQSGLLNDKLLAIVHRQDLQIELQKLEITAIRQLLTDRGIARDFPAVPAPPVSAHGGIASDLASIQAPPVSASPIPSTAHSDTSEKSAFENAMASLPLMIDAKTYNTSHPNYEASLVRNFPGKIFNRDRPSKNPVYASLEQMVKGDEVPDRAWGPVLKEALEEARTVPHSEEVFERRTYIENYMKTIAEKYQAHYAAGWVNLDDALFLYWLVRKLKPTTIVQTGVCNGLSSAFMMLGLVKNGTQGSLHVIDLPPVFNSKDPVWTIKGKVYGVVIPEGKSTGWMVPDAYRDRFEVWSGDAKALLPKMVDKVDSIDLFYHDSDHTYDHMMFEFREAKRKLMPGGLIVGDDVSWNASVWDFADEYKVPSYNFKGAVGVAFF